MPRCWRFALAAWPSVGSGQASVAGYIKLDDSAIWLGLIAHVMEHGRHIADVPPSTFELDLRYWIGTGYPVGTFLPVGVAAKLSGQDYANAYQPVLAVTVAIFALGAYGCVRELVSKPLACGAAVVAAQASLFAGYVQWGGVKEVTLVALLPPLAAFAVGRGVALRRAGGGRRGGDPRRVRDRRAGVGGRGARRGGRGAAGLARGGGGRGRRSGSWRSRRGRRSAATRTR